MTPLLRWVFLALLVSSVVGLAAHQKDDACVPICRAQKRSPEKIAGACDYRRLILQSDGDHSAVRHLFRTCLIPCDTSDTPEDRLLFLDTPDCRSFRDKLISLRSCSCESLGDGIAAGIDWAAWADKLFTAHAKLNRKSPEDASADNRLRGSAKTRDHLSGGRRMADCPEPDCLNGSEMGENGVTPMANAGAQPGSTPDTNLSEEDTVDWEMWCMTQCDNGQGGSACNCDIIP